MNKGIIYPLFFLLSIGLALGAGGWDEGGWDEGTWDFGTPALAPVVQPSSSSGGGSGGSSGGGGYVHDGLTEGSKTTKLNYGDAFIFRSKGHKHTTVILKVTEETIKIRITSNPIEFTLKEGETKELDTDSNGKEDFSATLNKITSKYGGEFTFTIIDEKAKPVVVEEPAKASGGCITCQMVYEDHYDNIFVKEYNSKWKEFCEYEEVDFNDWGWIYNEDKCYEYPELEITEVTPVGVTPLPTEPENKSKIGWAIAALIIMLAIIGIIILYYRRKKNAEKRT